MDLPAETELAVVGGGPGGYVAAIRAAQFGVDVTLVERDRVGGVCLNHGCIPSKALLSATGLAERAAAAAEMGVHADPEVRPDELRAWTGDVVDGMTRSVGKLCRANGVTLVEGTATFVGPDRLHVAAGDGDGATIEFDAAVVATGSRPVELPGFPFADDPVLDSRAALALDPVPDRLVVVGGGYIGMELATVHARLGTDVAVAEMLDGVLPEFPADLARRVRRRATEAGVAFHLNHRAQGYRETGDGVAVTVAGPDGERTLRGDAVLVAVGREPVTDTVDPEAAGLAVDDDGFLPTTDRMETPVEGVYAVGDVAGDPMLAHAAGHEGRVAAAAVAGRDPPTTARAVPAVAYTDPEVATVGLTADAAEAAAREVVVGEFPLRASGRAATAGDADGVVRVVADPDDGTVLGGSVAGSEASELVAELGLAVQTEATVAAVAETVHAHPTFAEATMEAAENALGRAVHTLNR